MLITDYSKILSATPIYPDLVSDNAKEKLIEMFNSLKEKKKELSSLRMKANLLDQEIKPLEAKYNEIVKMFNIEYDTKEIQEIKDECMLGVFNKDDARNW